MNFTKMLGLAVLAALAATMFVGAGSASAWGFCKVKGEAPCKTPYTAGTIYTGTLVKPLMSFTGHSEALCETAGFAFEQTSGGGAPPVGNMTTATFGLCNSTVAAVNLPWHIEIEDVSSGKGTWEARISSSGAGSPGVTVAGCTYTATTMVFALTDTLVTGGNAKMVGEVPLTGPCGSETMEVEYRISSPSVIYPG
jgi:hypothetical protein